MMVVVESWGAQSHSPLPTAAAAETPIKKKKKKVLRGTCALLPPLHSNNAAVHSPLGALIPPGVRRLLSGGPPG